MRTPVTATQMIYLGTQGITDPKYDHSRHCHICGGSLLLNGPTRSALNDLSGSWTDANLSLRLDSDDICSACSWFITGMNRIRMWKKGSHVLYATANQAQFLGIPDFYRLLVDDFETPAVFIMRGTDPKLSQKYIAWRALNGITYNRQNTSVTFFGLQLWKESKTVGTAIFDADKFVETVNTLFRLGRPFADKWLEYIMTTEKKKFKKISQWRTTNVIWENLLRAVDNQLTTELYLATYVASHLVAESIYSGGEKNGKS